MEGQQIGVIVYGAGLNPRPWLDEAKANGYQICLCNNHAEIWERTKKK